MNKNIIVGIIIIVLTLIGWLVFSKGDSNTNDPSKSVQISEEKSFDKAPIFTLKDYDGNDVSSGDFEGKILVVNSWATWCPFCVDELPDFVELQEAFADEMVVIAIDRAESLAQARDYTDSRLNIAGKLTFLLDPSDSFYKSIGGFSMPETLFIDAEGNIRTHKRGPMKFDEMKEKINSILGES